MSRDCGFVEFGTKRMPARPVTQAWTPACMEPDELAGWQEKDARVRSTGGSADLPCSDCLPAFSDEMHKAKSPEYPQGRCNGMPKGGQEVDAMDQPAPIAARGLTIPRRVQLEVSAPPCGSCAHEPICALRAAFESMATVETSAPPLPAGLRLALVATVECSHFLRDKAKPAPVRVLTSQERGQANGAALHRTLNLTPEQRALRSERTTAMNLARSAAREGAAAG
jgi:hypothetical protein